MYLSDLTGTAEVCGSQLFKTQLSNIFVATKTDSFLHQAKGSR